MKHALLVFTTIMLTILLVACTTPTTEAAADAEASPEEANYTSGNTDTEGESNEWSEKDMEYFNLGGMTIPYGGTVMEYSAVYGAEGKAAHLRAVIANVDENTNNVYKDEVLIRSGGSVTQSMPEYNYFEVENEQYKYCLTYTPANPLPYESEHAPVPDDAQPADPAAADAPVLSTDVVTILTPDMTEPDMGPQPEQKVEIVTPDASPEENPDALPPVEIDPREAEGEAEGDDEVLGGGVLVIEILARE